MDFIIRPMFWADFFILEVNMLEKLKLVVLDAESAVENANSMTALAEVKVKFLGKNGELTAILKGLKDVPPAEKPAFGKLVNEGRQKIEKIISEKEVALKDAEKTFKLKSEKIDVTEPAKKIKVGSLHPLTHIKNTICNIFIGMGFEVCEGPEIETDYYNFQALNIPKDHPARDMQDTFYFSENLLLRTHTSPCQVHTMEAKKPPIRMICPGKVYRSDYDATHSPMFQQIEGLVVDKGITLCDLKGIFDEFVKAFFSPESKTRLRPSYFPFTEPSVEMDVTCSVCGGKGCRICKGTGWIEVLGAGIVNPKVLKGCNIDNEKYSGLAFGLGIDRLAMIKYGIPDMRLLFENDMRFLAQFKD